MSCTLLPVRYYGSVAYYIHALRSEAAGMCLTTPYDKRDKAAHRCDIADTHGRISLTVPVERPHGMNGRATWADVGLSSHGQWWHVHRVTLESAYGRTPFFEFYIDRFLPFLRCSVIEEYRSVSLLDAAIDREIRRILLLPDATAADAEAIAARSSEILKIEQEIALPQYYQVRQHTQGFIPNLSVLDLIFNLGPESALYIRQEPER